MKIEENKRNNKANAIIYLNEKKENKVGDFNPWDKVIENVEIKEGNYKGTKDIKRMRDCIIQRREDVRNQLQRGLNRNMNF